MINCMKINYFLIRYQIFDFFHKMLFNKGPPYEKLRISRCDIGCDIPDVKDVESVTPLPVTSDVTSYLSHLQRTPWLDPKLVFFQFWKQQHNHRMFLNIKNNPFRKKHTP